METGTLNISDLQSPSEDKIGKLIKPVGSLDESNVDKLSKQIYELLDKHPENLYLLFDLSELEYMNSKTIGYFTDWYSRINEGGGKITLSNAADNIKDILETVGLLELVNIYSTVDEAKARLFD